MRCLAFQKTSSGWRLPYFLCEGCFIGPPRRVAQTWAQLLINLGAGGSSSCAQLRASVLRADVPTTLF